MSWNAIGGINQYFGDSILFLLFFISILFIINEDELGKERQIILGYYFCIAVILLTPILGDFFGRLIGKDVMWRMGWLLFVPILLAFSFTYWVYGDGDTMIWANNKIIQSFTVCIVFLCLFISNEFVFSGDNFSFEHNPYKVSDECIAVVDYLVEENELYILATPSLASQIRQYEPKIRLFAGRWPNYEDKHSVYVHVKLSEDIVDTKEIIRKCKQRKCEIVILKGELLDEPLESYGASVMKEIGGYKIYRIVL